MNYGNSYDMKRTKRTGHMNDDTRVAEDVYCALSEHMAKGISFHEQLADYFCFLGLHGYKKMLEYQYMEECESKRHLHKRYIEQHGKIIVPKEIQIPMFIPKDWSKYTTKDIDDSLVPKFVRSALEEYRKWEEQTKEVLKEQCSILMDANMIPDYEYVKEIIVDVEEEIKKVRKIVDKLNGTGYDVTMIHGVQDRYYDEYKKKFDDKFTTKNNYRPYPQHEPIYEGYENRDRRRRTMEWEDNKDWDYRKEERRRRIGYNQDDEEYNERREHERRMY